MSYALATAFTNGSFQKVANTAVRDEVAARRSDPAMTAYERSDHGLLEWLKSALARGGAAIYGRPNVAQPHNAREQLGSSTNGSIASEEPYPIGALALSAAAVQRAFEWYINDQPRGIKQTNFSLNNVGELTGFWQENAIADLLTKPHRLDRILGQALKMVEAPAAADAKPSRSRVNAASLYLRERSSSPVVVSV
ncbi:hypothetical protein FKP32DRAFT_1609017 [Trametes sanguinea]|nr:hypothetical protein FKP32DRAFT_1609017 [Trametes sanguinea]